jgi:gas vesicle protein
MRATTNRTLRRFIKCGNLHAKCLIIVTMKNNNDGLMQFLFGLFFGVLAGYLAGLLNAQKTGPELKRDLELNSSDFLSTVKDKFEDFRDQTNVALKEFKGFTDEKLKASAASIEEKVNSLGEQLEDLKEKQAASIKN